MKLTHGASKCADGTDQSTTGLVMKSLDTIDIGSLHVALKSTAVEMGDNEQL